MITNRWFLPRIFRIVVNPTTARGGMNLWIILEMRSDAIEMSGGFESLEYNLARRYRVHGKPIYDCLFRAKTVNARWRNNRSSRLLFLLSLYNPSIESALLGSQHPCTFYQSPGMTALPRQRINQCSEPFHGLPFSNSPPPLIYINRIDLMQCVGVGWCFFQKI